MKAFAAKVGNSPSRLDNNNLNTDCWVGYENVYFWRGISFTAKLVGM